MICPESETTCYALGCQHYGCINKFPHVPTPEWAESVLTGWRCPNCGAGVSPSEKICPCKPLTTGEA